MVLPRRSGASADIYAKLANGMARYNCAQASLQAMHRCFDPLRVVNKNYREVTHRHGSGRETRNPYKAAKKNYPQQPGSNSTDQAIRLLLLFANKQKGPCASSYS